MTRTCGIGANNATWSAPLRLGKTITYIHCTLDVAAERQIVIGRSMRNSRDWTRVDPEFKRGSCPFPYAYCAALVCAGLMGSDKRASQRLETDRVLRALSLVALSAPLCGPLVAPEVPDKNLPHRGGRLPSSCFCRPSSPPAPAARVDGWVQVCWRAADCGKLRWGTIGLGARPQLRQPSLP